MFLLELAQLALLFPQLVSDLTVPVFLMVEGSLCVLELKTNPLEMLSRLLVITLDLLLGALLLVDRVLQLTDGVLEVSNL